MTNTTKNTEASVLAHHGIVATGGQNLTDAARAAGLISACLGCGSVAGINPDAERGGRTLEEARVDTRDNLDCDWECCPDADSFIY